MPFTPSHAVVALPFVRTPLVPAAVAIGAMTPDLPLFLRGFGITYSFTHTWANLLWTMVLALGLFLLWRVVLRPAASELSPRWLAQRLPHEWDSPASDAAARAVGIGRPRAYGPLLVVSLALGVTSHIVWDSFTHEARAGVELLPALAEQWGPLLGYKWLQYGSGILGIVIIAIWALWKVRRAEPRAAADRVLPGWVRIVWWLSLPVILVAAWIIGSVVYGPFTAEFTYRHLAYRMLPPACGIWAMLTLGLCVVTAIVGGRHPVGAATPR
ncbi:DUF4184 family protein [Microbacterium sp.]|uniref:DUF4184 family protein n=1 Tax=Microbacterium sp. TaxID=51671 RepID=UPI002629E477|nr:DUF4184 family protein [Microbacterium sp.]